MTTLHTVRLACGHTRQVVDGIRRMIDAGHITTQTCLTCRKDCACGWQQDHPHSQWCGAQVPESRVLLAPPPALDPDSQWLQRSEQRVGEAKDPGPWADPFTKAWLPTVDRLMGW